jgi:putative membrane protein insertion efficiency factor
MGINLSGIGFLATKKLISSLNTGNIIYSAADSEADDTDIDTEVKENKPKVEVEGEIMSSSMIIDIGFYKKWISPLLPPACRFLPTCSQYGVQAIQEFGPTKGVILTAWRLARCSPLGGKGSLHIYLNE